MNAAAIISELETAIALIEEGYLSDAHEHVWGAERDLSIATAIDDRYGDR